MKERMQKTLADENRIRNTQVVRLVTLLLMLCANYLLAHTSCLFRFGPKQNVKSDFANSILASSMPITANALLWRK